MARKTKPSLPQILLVEGKNDLHVMLSLCAHHNLPETFEILDKEGVENVLETLEAEIAGQSRQRIGIIVDADTDLKARWAAISSILSKWGYLPPEIPDQNGTILLHDRKPTIGVWLMPDNRLPGELEDFIAFLVPESDSLWNHAAHALALLPNSPGRFPDQDRSKAHIHTWLAWQYEPGKPLGQAITARYLDANAPDAQRLIAWLKNLFIQSPQALST
ncbi:DUF3226 domain-containing protein [Methylomagnum ishizawai]|uniref:DUF3226 domain-containing protein n=1 Tax=Methylomagnum ishizawai TaxID=1760988 RepID=UPI001C32D061|nr:DUF3226 domain-containing protein [Methylomagnum ishizawai]BBL76744.1 hypothetical protein MishRS11D_38420 [Methylomagnum ishizawai]